MLLIYSPSGRKLSQKKHWSRQWTLNRRLMEKVFDSSSSHTPERGAVGGEQAQRDDGSQISQFPDKWASLKVCYSDIEQATNGLNETSMIGRGGYGSVYKGKLGRNAVAIKILDSTSKQGQKEFYQELEVLYQMKHPNLVKLVGACFEVRAFVYEYLPRGSLEDFLNENPNLLTWQMRTRIVYEICSALIYLQSRSVVHGDLKPANILLDANFKSKLSDFGLCRFLPKDMTTSVFLETIPKGTSGYIDPWFLDEGILRPGSDLYSFGITILKLLTGLPPVGLGRKARDTDENSFREMIDSTAGSWPIEVAKELLYWSLQCCYHNDQKSLGLLKDMETSLEDMLAEIETLQGGGFKVAMRGQRTVEVDDLNEEPEIIVVVKIHMHSEAYAEEIKERILRMKGVQAAETELEASLVSVIGVFDPSKLVEYVYRMTSKRALIIKVQPLDERIELGQPLTVKVKPEETKMEVTEPDGSDDAELDAKANDFIKRFKQQLKLSGLWGPVEGDDESSSEMMQCEVMQCVSNLRGNWKKISQKHRRFQKAVGQSVDHSTNQSTNQDDTGTRKDLVTHRSSQFSTRRRRLGQLVGRQPIDRQSTEGPPDVATDLD